MEDYNDLFDSFLTNFAKEIKLIAMDIDGVLTDGSIFIDSSGRELKKFNVKDGMGIRLLQKYNFHVAFISGGSNKVIARRARSLKVKYVFTGKQNKYQTLNNLQKKLDIKKEETAFLGDDINDLTVLPIVALFCCPSDAHPSCIKSANWISKNKGGNGFVREFVDKFLFVHNIDPWVPFKTKNS